MCAPNTALAFHTVYMQVLNLLEEGECNRHVGSTKMNDTSSRSHTVFRMVRIFVVTGCRSTSANSN
jgi:hypothetical protein